MQLTQRIAEQDILLEKAASPKKKEKKKGFFG